MAMNIHFVVNLNYVAYIYNCLDKFIAYLSYLFIIGEESWREMAHEAVQNNMELQLELIRGVHSFGSAQESVYWARRYQIPLTELPYDTRALLEKESAG
jgi:hypothetical protein